MKKLSILFIIILFLLAVPFKDGENVILAKSASSQISNEELLKLADSLMNTVTSLRGLKFKTPVKKKVTTQDEVRKIMLAQLNTRETQDKIYGEGRMFKKLGLIPVNFDYGKFLVDLYVDQLAGFYIPEEKTMYIASWMEPELQSSILAHELTHALQDQYFDLVKLLKSDTENSDRNMSKNSVVEGEATLVMLSYMMRNYGMKLSDLQNFSMVQFKELLPYASDSKVLASAPKIIVETLNFPYIYGTDFLMNYVSKNGWQRVAYLYTDLPVSSEQIMHPSKYTTKRDMPQIIDLSSVEKVAGKEWKKINTDVLGEFFIATMLEEYITKGNAKVAAEGWGGDKILVFEKNSSAMLIFMTSWDSKDDGKEFFNAYCQLIEKKYNNEILDDNNENYKLWKTGTDYVYTGKKDNRVIIIEGASENTINSILKACWK